VDGGWIRIVPYAGSFVSSPTFQQVRDTFELRRAVEELAIELAVTRAEPYDVTELSGIVDLGMKALAARDVAEMARLNSVFHIQISLAARNQLVVDLMRRMQRKIEWQFRGVAHRLSAASWQEHRDMVDALRDRDIARATGLARGHIERTETVFLANWRGEESTAQSSWSLAPPEMA
jgi:DNA-binding GntR family transcriptional regulator